MRCIVTGSAGFVGFHLAQQLIEAGHEVLGIDGMTHYYDIRLKQRRHQILAESSSFSAQEILLEDSAALGAAYRSFQPEMVFHLAAQAGVRYSLENPRAYVDANLIGTFNVLELVKSAVPQHFLLASTSSVYGANASMPFREADRTDHPLTLYAATKKAAEEMAHCYSHLWKIPTTVFRFFSVYGPWGRPDMALFLFTRAILENKPIDLFNHGDMERDFTYIDDLVKAVVLLSSCIPQSPASLEHARSTGDSPAAPFRVVNIGNAAPVRLLDFVQAIERAAGKTADRHLLPMQPGDVRRTFADNEVLYRLTGYRPQISVQTGVERFVAWYRDYYGI